MSGGPFSDSVAVVKHEVHEHKGTVTIEHEFEGGLFDLELEQRSHDAEINRIAMALELPRGSTIEDICEKIKALK